MDGGGMAWRTPSEKNHDVENDDDDDDEKEEEEEEEDDVC